MISDIVIDMCNVEQPENTDFKWVGLYPDKRVGLCFTILVLLYKDKKHLYINVNYPPTFKGIDYKCYTVYVNDREAKLSPRLYHRTLKEALNEANLWIDSSKCIKSI